MEVKPKNPKQGYLFTVEIMLEEMSNGLALEKLLQLLNRSEAVADYKVVSGIELGKLIELNRPSSSPSPSKPAKAAVKQPQAKQTVEAKEKPKSSPQAVVYQSILEQFEQLKNNNQLIRLSIVKSKGLRLSMPCRIVHFDSNEQTVTVYHVDDKKVYTFGLNEVEDFTI